MTTIATYAPLSRPRRIAGTVLGRWIAVARERRALARLTAAELRDVGIAPQAARAEATRPFWDMPAGR